jgi:hypothetical protein
VCFLVRTASMHDAAPPPPEQQLFKEGAARPAVETFTEVDIYCLIRSKCVLHYSYRLCLCG